MSNPKSAPEKNAPMTDQRAMSEAYWRDLWQKRTWRSYLLWPLSFLFCMVSRARRVLYRTGFLDAQAAPIPVIVVGGIMVGGVGKTPIVNAVAVALQKAGFKPAVISRGYTLDKTKNDAPPRPVTLLSQASDVGDEPILHHLKTGLPVWVGRNRGAAAQMLCRTHPECDVIICDDGLQHYALSRDIELIVMDDRCVGNGWCLPAGPLREPPARLDEADAVVWNRRCHDKDEALRLMERETNQLARTVPHFNLYSYVSDAYDLLDPTYRLPLSFFAGKSTVSFAGIAQPEVFFNMLSANNITSMQIPLPDHFEFDAAFAKQDAIVRAQYVLMTEKDAVKYREFVEAADSKNTQRFWVVPLEIMNNSASQKLTDFLIQRLHEVAHEFK